MIYKVDLNPCMLKNYCFRNFPIANGYLVDFLNAKRDSTQKLFSLRISKWLEKFELLFL